jgi:hypothetical protein
LKKTREVQQVETRQDIVGKKFNSGTIDVISPQDADGLDQHLRVGCTIWTITDNSTEEHLRQLIDNPDLAREFGETFLKGWGLEEFIKTATSMIPKLARKMHRLGRISYKVLIFYGIKFTTQIGAVFAEPHWPAQPAMIGYTL